MTAEEVRQLRQQFGLTQEELAQRIGVTVSTVQKWEGGHRHPGRMAIRLIEQMKERCQ